MTAFLTILALFAVTGLVLALACGLCAVSGDAGRRGDALRRLPGALGESAWGDLDDWDEHCATTPGMGDLGETPIFDALCFQAWEADISEDAS